jgi:hypothetical protein
VGDVGIGLAASLTPKCPLLAIRNASVVFPSAPVLTGHADFSPQQRVTDLTRADRAHAACCHTGGIAGDPGFASETLRAHDAIEMSDLVTSSSLLC